MIDELLAECSGQVRLVKRNPLLRRSAAWRLGGPGWEGVFSPDAGVALVLRHVDHKPAASFALSRQDRHIAVGMILIHRVAVVCDKSVLHVGVVNPQMGHSSQPFSLV